MPDVFTIGGSPSLYSKSAALLAYSRNFLEREGLTTAALEVRDLPAEDLLFGKTGSPAIGQSLQTLAAATTVIVATPVYKAAYTGILKAYLDLLPQNALADKTVLPLAVGGSPAHTLALDYALKPVLAALGARHFLPGVYITDNQIVNNGVFGQFELQPEIELRLHGALGELVSKVPVALV
jgi:FMN reductase